MEKIIDAKAQANLQPTFYNKEIDQWCLRRNKPNSTKASIQSNLIKDLKMKKTRSTPEQLKALALQQPEASEKARKEKNKDRHNWRKQKSFTPATGVDAAKPGKPN